MQGRNARNEQALTTKRKIAHPFADPAWPPLCGRFTRLFRHECFEETRYMPDLASTVAQLAQDVAGLKAQAAARRVLGRYMFLCDSPARSDHAA
jgi:hypothetical protein